MLWIKENAAFKVKAASKTYKSKCTVTYIYTFKM